MEVVLLKKKKRLILCAHVFLMKNDNLISYTKKEICSSVNSLYYKHYLLFLAFGKECILNLSSIHSSYLSIQPSVHLAIDHRLPCKVWQELSSI